MWCLISPAALVYAFCPFMLILCGSVYIRINLLGGGANDQWPVISYATRSRMFHIFSYRHSCKIVSYHSFISLFHITVLTITFGFLFHYLGGSWRKKIKACKLAMNTWRCKIDEADLKCYRICNELDVWTRCMNYDMLQIWYATELWILWICRIYYDMLQNCEFFECAEFFMNLCRSVIFFKNVKLSR